MWMTLYRAPVGLKAGGRFNGLDADKRLQPPFPALHIAEQRRSCHSGLALHTAPLPGASWSCWLHS
jgi:hypothetical protein